MKLSRYLAVLIGFLLFGSCQQNSKSKKPPSTAHAAEQRKHLDSLIKDSFVMAQVENLPEYKALKRQFLKLNHDTSNHFAVLLAARPNSSIRYYSVKLGENNAYRFHTWEQFYVDPKNLTITYYDIISDSVLTLNQWRKTKEYRQYIQ
jgi:hypothetical protein